MTVKNVNFFLESILKSCINCSNYHLIKGVVKKFAEKLHKFYLWKQMHSSLMTNKKCESLNQITSICARRLLMKNSHRKFYLHKDPPINWCHRCQKKFKKSFRHIDMLPGFFLLLKAIITERNSGHLLQTRLKSW